MENKKYARNIELNFLSVSIYVVEGEYIKFHCSTNSMIDLKDTFLYVKFDIDQFLHFLMKNDFEAIEDDNVMIEYYIEDEEGVTYCETSPVNYLDYVVNYMNNDAVQRLLDICVSNFKQVYFK